MKSATSYPALQHRNFRLLWIGQCISVPGTLMQNVAVLWHVSLLADSGQKALALGMVGLVRVVPIIILSLFGGVFADAIDRRKLMLTTQVLLASVAALLAILTIRGLESLWSVYVLTGMTSAIASFDGPARTSLVPNLVRREHLSNAISLNTTMFQLSSVIGPAFAGIALIWLDVGWVYALNSLSFLAVIVALIAMRDVPARPREERSSITWRAGLEGLRFVFQTPLIRSSMLLDFNAAFFSTASALLPIFAQDVLQVGSVGFGWLCAAPSVGAVIASAYMVKHEAKITRRGRVLFWAVAGYGLATVGFGLSTNFGLTLLLLALVGAFDTVNMVLRNVIRQLSTPDRLRGRMTSVNVIFSQGGPQLGELEAGVVAQAIGAPLSVITGGLACLGATAWIAWKSPVLRDYGMEPARGAAGAATAPAGPITRAARAPKPALPHVIN